MFWRRDSRYRRGADGKAPCERDTRRKWSRQTLELKERVFMREARARINRPKQDWEPPLVEIRYADRHARTGPVIGLTLPEVVIGSCPERLAESTKWNTDVWLEFRGFAVKASTEKQRHAGKSSRGSSTGVTVAAFSSFEKSHRHPTFTCLDWTLPSVARQLFAQCLRSCLEDSRVERIQIKCASQ